MIQQHLKNKIKIKSNNNFQTVNDQKGNCISQETVLHDGKKIIINATKCFKNKLVALKKNSMLANKAGIQ